MEQFAIADNKQILNMSANVKMYSTRFCPYCVRARNMLDAKGVNYTDIAVDGAAHLRSEMVRASGRYTVPQIWIGAQHVGGYDDLAALERQGRLDNLLKQA